MNNCSCVIKKDSWTGRDDPAYEEEKTLDVKLKWGASKLLFEGAIKNRIKSNEAKFSSDKDSASYHGRYDGLYCASQMLFSPLHDHIPMGGKVVHLIETRHLFDVVSNVIEYLAMSHGGRHTTLTDYKTNPLYRQELISSLDEAMEVFEYFFGKQNIVVWVMQYYLKSHMLNYGLEYADANASFNPSRIDYWRNEIISYLSPFLVPSLEYKRFVYEANPKVYGENQRLAGTFDLQAGMKVRLGLSGYRCSQDTISRVLFGITKEMKSLCEEPQCYTISKIYKRIRNNTGGSCFFDSQFEAVVFEEISQIWPIRFLDLAPVL